MNALSKTVVVTVAASLLITTTFLLPDAPTPFPEYGESDYTKRSQGGPDQFLEYQRQIRTSVDGEMGYPMGYRVVEHQKAMANAKTGRSLSWIERGPGNAGGRTRSLVMDPDDPTMMTWWAGSVSGGLWKTTDGGVSWKSLTEHLPIMAIGSLVMAPSDRDVMYMGTGEGFGGITYMNGDGIFKSTDRGNTWVHLPSTIDNLDFMHVNRMAVDPMDADVVLAATGAGIFRTTNGGTTWTQVYKAETRIEDLRAQPGNFNRLIASENRIGILYSDDAGVSWKRALTSIPEGIGRIELAYSESYPEVAYAAGPTTNNRRAHLLHSKDGGRVWGHTTMHSYNWFTWQGWHDNSLAVHPFNTDTIFVGGVHLRRVIMGDSLGNVGAPSSFETDGTEAWMTLNSHQDGTHLDGIVSYPNPTAKEVTAKDFATLEIRFGQGTQKAHRFTVAEDAGTYNNGGSGVDFNDYQYRNYVEVPFQVWDLENNRQLMISFRDQADNRVFDLVEFYSSPDPNTPRDEQSFEYLFLHHYEYDDTTPHASIATDGGQVYGMLYHLWPSLARNATWNPGSLPRQSVRINYVRTAIYDRVVDEGISVNSPWIPHVDHHVLQTIPIDAANNEFWIMNANDGGVARSIDGGVSFTELDGTDFGPSAGYNTTQFYGVAKRPGKARYIGGTQDNGTWSTHRHDDDPNHQSAWRFTLGADGIEAAWHATDPNLVIGTNQQTVIYLSKDDGESWALTLDRYRHGGIFLTPIATSDRSPDDVYSLAFDGLWYTRDFGLTEWKNLPPGPNWGLWIGSTTRVSQADPNIVWIASGHDSRTREGRRIQVSTDRAKTFSSVPLPDVARPPEAVVSGFATHPAEPQTAYALFSVYGRAKILKTEDLGNTWTDLSQFDASGKSTNGFPDLAVFDFIVMPNDHRIMWAGTEIGLVESENQGETWLYVNNGLPAVPVWRIKARDDELILATHGRGIWTVPLGEVTDVEEDPGALPSRFTLAQNYPNPFNASTNIQFEISDGAHVRIAVYDVLGRMVTLLTDQVYTSGIHDLTWDASAQASGIYFYRMESGDQLIQTQKMTLLK